MSVIHRLSVQLANQIAAGEVVERPASAVKELLENAIDAGASHIWCEIKGAGRILIKVRDNGCGIACDDLALALAPHATSKIASLSDLEAVATLGFRGEALASIAAVSKLTLTSKFKTAAEAWAVRVEGAAQKPEVMPAAHPDGTSVEVRELFFNTPARRRFLRSDRTEMLRIREVFVRCALAHPECAFDLISDDRAVLKAPAAADENSRLQRIKRLTGCDFPSSGLKVSVQDQTLSLKGWILPPQPGGGPDAIYIFLNGRPISDKLILHALREAMQESYGGAADNVRCVLYLNCDPKCVDVNVHPRKDEVRFHEARRVHDLIASGLIKALKPQDIQEKTVQGNVFAPLFTPPSHKEEELPAACIAPLAQIKPAATRPSEPSRPVPRSQSVTPVRKTEYKPAEPGPAPMPILNPSYDADERVRSGLELKLLSLPAPGVMLIVCGGRYFLVKAQALNTYLQAQNYSLDVKRAQVETFALSLPFSVAVDKSLINALKLCPQEAERCGFKFKVRAGKAEFSALPLICKGTDAAGVALQALHLIAAGAKNLAQGQCPQQLANLLGKLKPAMVNHEGAARDLLAKAHGLEDLLALGNACREIDLSAMARTLLQED